MVLNLDAFLPAGHLQGEAAQVSAQQAAGEEVLAGFRRSYERDFGGVRLLVPDRKFPQDGAEIGGNRDQQ